MLSLPRSQVESEVMLDLVMRDTMLPVGLKRRILEDIVNEQITTTDDEHLSAYERATRAGEKRGERRGERRGEKRGERRGVKRGARQALLQVAGKIAPEELLRLEAIGDVAALEAEVLRLVAK